MKNEFKYLTIGDEDVQWGLFVNVAGTAEINPETEYPSKEHPSGYFFDWEEGRILHEFQINYITHGTGILENKHGKFPLREGSLFFTFPGEWHRYKPHKKTGWKETYIGFNGEIARMLLKNPVFNLQNPVIQIGIKEEILDSYLKIFDLIDKELPGFQQIASGYIVKLLGTVISFEKQKGFSGKKIARAIEEVRFIMRQNIENNIDLEGMARQINTGYSYFRKMFKKYTGVSPGQYHLQLRMMRAKELLVSTDKSIKEISYEIGFQSIFHFSNLFKTREGITPSQFRRKNLSR